MRYELRGVLVKVDVLIHDPMDDEEAIRPSRGISSVHVSNVTTMQLIHPISLLFWKVVDVVQHRAKSIPAGIGRRQAHVPLCVAGVVGRPV